MGSGKKVTIGYKYYLDIHMGVARGPIDELVAIEADKKRIWSGSVRESGRTYIDAPKAFGGEKKEGGVQGSLHVLMGEPSQDPTGVLSGLLKDNIPGFRGVCTLFFSGLIACMNWNIKEWRIRARRAKKGWDGPCWNEGQAVIPLAAGQIIAMNPAHIIYEALTNRDWGGGNDRSRINDASFANAASTLYQEGFGLCLLWAREQGVDDFIKDVLEHISGVLYQSRTDGQLHLKLFRGDYDPAALPLFTPDSGLLDVDDDSGAGGSGGTNEFIVKWKDAITGQERQVRERNIAAIHSDGCISSETKDFPGLPTYELASRVALRELAVRAAGLKKFKLKLDRRGYALNPGDVFRIADPKRGIENMVLRVARFEDGTLDKGAITVEALQDVFGMPANSLSATQPSGWSPPDYTPRPISVRRIFELPWRDLVATHSAADVEQIDRKTAFVAGVAAKSTPASFSYALQTRVGGGDFSDRDVDSYTPTAVLAASAGRLATTISVVDGEDLDLVRPGSAALIDDEIVRVDSINLSSGLITISRGCIDTVPAPHAKASRVWFYEDAYSSDGTPYGPGTTAQARMLSQTSGGTLDPAQAQVDSLPTNRRIARPYPPGNVRVGGELEPAAVVGQIVVTWAHRDKLLQADQLVPWVSGPIGPEAGTTYSLRLFRKDNNAQLAALSDVAGASAHLGPVGYAGAVVLEIWSVLGGMESWQRARVEFGYSPA